MFCTQCGKEIDAESRFCPFCGQTTEQSAQAVQPEPGPAAPKSDSAGQTGNLATLKGLKCPYCASEQWRVTGAKGAMGAAIATGVAFGAIGNLVAGSSAKKNMTTTPLQYKCAACKKKFESLPLAAAPEDVLEVPCTVTFVRERSFVGAAVPQIVHLNGVKIAPVKNGKAIAFATSNRHNVLFVTDQYGVAFPDMFRFEAVSGGAITVRFNRKFI